MRQVSLRRLTVAAAVVLAISGGWWWLARRSVGPSRGSPPSPAPGAPAPVASSAEQLALEQRYRVQLIAIARSAAPRDGGPVNYAALREQLLAVTVPGSFRQLHLDLVVATDRVARGQAQADQALVEDGLTRLAGVIGREAWLEPFGQLLP